MTIHTALCVSVCVSCTVLCMSLNMCPWQVSLAGDPFGGALNSDVADSLDDGYLGPFMDPPLIACMQIPNKDNLANSIVFE